MPPVFIGIMLYETVMDRPDITKELNSKDFLEFYYLKEELVAFCRENGLPASGSKQELTSSIAYYLDTGKVKPAEPKAKRTAKPRVTAITKETLIESGFVCSELHRAFFKSELGDGFSFNVAFQKWLKENAGKTYADAIEAYKEIKEAKKNGKTDIGKQFEYNTYVRAFFDDNKGASLEDAIKCWKYKKSLKGHNRYEKSDLTALDQ